MVKPDIHVAHDILRKIPWLSLQSRQLKHIGLITGVEGGQNRGGIAKSLSKILRAQPPQADSKILSIDMGVKNLAYCSLRPNVIPTKSDKDIARVSPKNPFHILAWERINLLDILNDPVLLQESDEEKASWTPSFLAPHAVRLAKQFLSHEPDALLIGRQRFRSGGHSAVQEWTLRVNTLEAMLWSSLETIRQSSTQYAQDSISSAHAVRLEQVLPSRLAAFWKGRKRVSDTDVVAGDDILALCSGQKPTPTQTNESDTVGAKLGNKALEKKDKIDMVKKWIAEGLVTAEDEGLQKKLREFGEVKPRRRKGGEESGDGMEKGREKLDDLADCMVQGVTWALWEENRRELRRLAEVGFPEGWKPYADDTKSKKAISSPKVVKKRRVVKAKTADKSAEESKDS